MLNESIMINLEQTETWTEHDVEVQAILAQLHYFSLTKRFLTFNQQDILSEERITVENSNIELLAKIFRKYKQIIEQNKLVLVNNKKFTLLDLEDAKNIDETVLMNKADEYLQLLRGDEYIDFYDYIFPETMFVLECEGVKKIFKFTSGLLLSYKTKAVTVDEDQTTKELQFEEPNFFLVKRKINKYLFLENLKNKTDNNIENDEEIVINNNTAVIKLNFKININCEIKRKSCVIKVSNIDIKHIDWHVKLNNIKQHLIKIENENNDFFYNKLKNVKNFEKYNDKNELKKICSSKGLLFSTGDLLEKSKKFTIAVLPAFDRTFDCIFKSIELKFIDKLYLTLDLLLDVKRIHEKGYIHRDIKPSNIMVTMDKNYQVLHVTLIDFASMVKDQVYADSIYTNGFFDKRLNHVDSENIKQTKYLDIYSLAAVIFLVFSDDYHKMCAELKTSDLPYLLETYGSSMDPSIKEICLRCVDMSKPFEIMDLLIEFLNILISKHNMEVPHAISQELIGRIEQVKCELYSKLQQNNTIFQNSEADRVEVGTEKIKENGINVHVPRFFVSGDEPTLLLKSTIKLEHLGGSAPIESTIKANNSIPATKIVPDKAEPQKRKLSGTPPVSPSKRRMV